MPPVQCAVCAYAKKRTLDCGEIRSRRCRLFVQLLVVGTAVDGNLSGLGFGVPRNRDGEHAVGELGREALLVERVGEREGPAEVAVRAAEQDLLLSASLELTRPLE